MFAAKNGTQDLDEREYSESEYKELEKLYESTLGSLNAGEIVKGRVVHIGDSKVAVDIGFKSEGSISVTEFSNIKDLKVGDEIEVFLETVEDKDGQLVLSRKRADFMRIWERVVRSFEKGEVLRGRCVRRTKGGIVVDLLGLDAFLPGSQIDVRPVRDFDAFIGREMDFRVVKVNHPSENVVVSHKILVEEELSSQRKAILEKLEKGQILEGHAKAITD
ncbi:MAG: S1 RNA-binding domain-containing protein, partial [Bacteroidota bacterium]